MEHEETGTEHEATGTSYQAPELTEFGTVEDFTHGIGISIILP